MCVEIRERCSRKETGLLRDEGMNRRDRSSERRNFGGTLDPLIRSS